MRFSLVFVALMLFAGCGNDRRIPGGNRPPPNSQRDASEDADGAQNNQDAGVENDSGVEPRDIGPNQDANVFPDAQTQDAIVFPDAITFDATPGQDAQPNDAGFPDVGFIDAGAGAASAQIAQVRASLDGPVGITIDGALVTYVKSQAVRLEGPGFAVQADQMGPALWINVDPATLSPPPVAGDRVRFTVITKITDQTGIRFATEIGNYTRLSSGNALAPLVQDLSSAPDVAINLENYETELVRVQGTIAASFRSAGSGHEAARIDTAALSGDPNLELRLPAVLNEQLGLALGCTFTVEAPLWRFTTRAQAHAWTSADFRVTQCPAPRLVAAAAPRQNRVILTFDRPIRRSSIQSGGGQISFQGGLSATGAFATTNVVVVTTTPQSPGVSYGVTVPGSITDPRGAAIDPAFRTASFIGSPQSAIVRINEINANMTGGCDLIELRVVEGGSMDGWSIQTRDLPIATFSGLNVARNAYVMVHANGTSFSCNPGSSASEINSPTDYPAFTYSSNFDSAYDWYGGAGGIVNTDTVITLYDANRNIVDAVLLTDDPTGSAAGGSEDQAAIVSVYGEWATPSGTIPPGGFVDDDFNANAVLDLNGTAIDVFGVTIQRSDNADANSRTGWTEFNTATWGFNNPGQSNF